MEFETLQSLRGYLVRTRTDQKLTQLDMAAKTGESQATISSFERGTTKLTAGLLTSYAQALGFRLTCKIEEDPHR